MKCMYQLFLRKFFCHIGFIKKINLLFVVAVCRATTDCSTGEKCVNSKCMIPCVTHTQCQTDQACVNGICILGCRSNKNCPLTESCINNKCQGTKLLISVFKNVINFLESNLTNKFN